MAARVSLTECRSYEAAEVRSALSACLAPLGGLGAFVRPGQRVLLKPNLIAAHAPGKPDTTHPRVVLAVAEEILRLGARCAIGDSPAFGKAAQVARRSGLLRGADVLGVPVIELRANVALRGAHISASLADYDVLISLPKLKAHNQLLLTGALKNCYGLVAGKAKAWRHFAARGDLGHFCRMLLAVHQAAAPALSIVDAVEVMEAKGPRGGAKRHLGLLAAGVDAAAIDTVLCQVVGLAPERVPLLAEAAAMGLGETRPQFIEVAGERPELFGRPLALPSELSDISFSPIRLLRSTLRHIRLKLAG